MVEAGLQEVDTYDPHLQNTVTKFIATRAIMYLCLEEEWIPVSSVTKQWWEYYGLNLEGMWAAAWEDEWWGRR